jgi:small-conductance mechanosensitive channel
MPNSDLTTQGMCFGRVISKFRSHARRTKNTTVISNYNKEPKMRADNNILIRHTEDVELVREIFLEVCARDDRILTVPKPVMRIKEFTKSGILVSCRPWVRQVHYWDVWFEFRGEALCRLMRNELDNNITVCLNQIISKKLLRSMV